MSGPAPKPEHLRARTNKDPIPTTRLVRTVADQPDLPSSFIIDGEIMDWPERTLQWWAMWRDSAQASQFTAGDWDFLLDTATLHARFWMGHVSVASELRLRVAKFGQTPEDRARLRIQFVDADQAESRHVDREQSSSRQQYGDLKVTSAAPAA